MYSVQCMWYRVQQCTVYSSVHCPLLYTAGGRHKASWTLQCQAGQTQAVHAEEVLLITGRVSGMFILLLMKGKNVFC